MGGPLVLVKKHHIFHKAHFTYVYLRSLWQKPGLHSNIAYDKADVGCHGNQLSSQNDESSCPHSNSLGTCYYISALAHMKVQRTPVSWKRSENICISQMMKVLDKMMKRKYSHASTYLRLALNTNAMFNTLL